MLSLGACGDKLKTDTEIDAGLRREIDSLNRVIIAAIHERKTETILQLGSKEFRELDSVRIKLRRLARDLSSFRLRGYEVEHQVYSNRFRPAPAIRVLFREGSEQEYAFSFAQPGRPTVATFARIPEDFREFGIVTSFSKAEGAWKLNSVRIGLLRVQGLNAVDWYYRAQQQDAAGAQMDAFIQQTMAKATLLPAGDHIRYRMEETIEHLGFAIESRAKNSFTFPIMTNPADSSGPRVLGASMHCDGSGCVPMFTIRTKTPLPDTASLAREGTAVLQHLDQWFAGVSNRNKIVALRMVNTDNFDESDSGTYRVMRRETIADWRY